MTNASISSLMNISLTDLSLPKSNLIFLQQVLICKTDVFLQLCQFRDIFQAKRTNKGPYKANIGGIRLKLPELQESDKKT